jgi:hypothetical protein
MEAPVTAAIITGISGIVGSIGAANITLKAKEDTKKQISNLEGIIIDSGKQTEQIFSELKGTLQEFAEEVIDPKKKQEIEQKIEVWGDQIKTLRDIFKELGIWKEASIWLVNNRERLKKEAYAEVIKKCDWLKNPGRALDSKEKIQKFQDSIDAHLQWVWANLDHGISVPFERGRLIAISDNEPYREAFEAIKKKIEIEPNQKGKKSWFGRRDKNQKESRKISNSAAKVLLDFVGFLIKEYS